jgi:poly-gamma-glutamate synthesis protein (capsule biosynthesis protein)
VVSIHWGANWGYDVPAQHLAFAQRLIGARIHLVCGHSAHHPLPIEIYRGRLVLYGCGDLIDDYEGIAGYEQYCDDLRRHCCVEPSRDLDAGNSSVRTLETQRIRSQIIGLGTVGDVHGLEPPGRQEDS